MVSLFSHRFCSFLLGSVASRRQPGLFFFSLIVFFLLQPVDVGAAQNASRLLPEDYSCKASFSNFTEDSPAPDKQSEWSRTWVEKNALQEHQFRRGETVDIFLCPEPLEWPISRVISLTDRLVFPVLKEIFLQYKFIRAGPAS